MTTNYLHLSELFYTTFAQYCTDETDVDWTHKIFTDSVILRQQSYRNLERLGLAKKSHKTQ